MGLRIVVTSPRVPPGVLSRAAWQAVDAADVLLARPGEPLAEALVGEGLRVEEVDLPVPDLARHLLSAATADPDRPTDPVHPTDPADTTDAADTTGAADTVHTVWLGSSDGDPGLTDAIATEATRLPDPPVVEIVVGSWDVPGARLLDVVAAMDRLRSPGGCPWDAEQTHESLAPYLVEETHEVLAAIAGGDRAELADELGDVLLQVAFHARVAEDADRDEDRFDIDDVAAGLVAKLVRRHPHVFADGDAASPEEVEHEWERIKAAERAERRTAPGGGPDLLDGIPSTLPAPHAAAKVASRLRRRSLTVDPDVQDDLDAALTALDAAEGRARAALVDLARSARAAE